MRVLLYFPKLDLHSGAAQLLRMQAEGLRAAGAEVRVAAERGGLRFFLSTGIRTQRASASAIATRPRRSGELIVDHDMAIRTADVLFVHNLATEANRYLVLQDSVRANWERQFLTNLPPETPIVANSELVKNALVRNFAFRPERIAVHHPGYQTRKFSSESRTLLRNRARRALGVDDATPLIGFVTSGAFHKRGLDVFLATADLIASAVADARFLIVGARGLPAEAAVDALVKSGRVLYRPKNHHPERWIAALDLFLYAARWEEFGMVVLEALALGVPILTSRRVGAAECLPAAYAAWLAAEPNAEAFAAMALRLMADQGTCERLRNAGVERASRYSDRAYAEATARTILRTADSSTH